MGNNRRSPIPAGRPHARSRCGPARPWRVPGHRDDSSQCQRMKGPWFKSYLAEEDLDWIVTARRAAGVSEAPATERFARYAKIVLRNGFGSGAHLTRPLGLRAEFVPMTDPTILRAGHLLTLQLLSDGQPVTGAAWSRRERAEADIRSMAARMPPGMSRCRSTARAHGWSARFTWFRPRRRMCLASSGIPTGRRSHSIPPPTDWSASKRP